jgi:hypothetical protein
MKFTEFNLFGVYVAPISIIMVARGWCWFRSVGLRAVSA